MFLAVFVITTKHKVWIVFAFLVAEQKTMFLAAALIEFVVQPFSVNAGFKEFKFRVCHITCSRFRPGLISRSSE